MSRAYVAPPTLRTGTTNKTTAASDVRTPSDHLKLSPHTPWYAYDVHVPDETTAGPADQTSDGPPDRTKARRTSGRREEILAATRTLFDQSGSRDAQIEDIARAVGINRAIIYRHFSSKEELFAEVVVLYLDELRQDLGAAEQGGGTPEDRLGDMTDAIIDFGLRNPAFVDCALTLVRRSADELMVEVGETAMTRLGTAMWECLQHVVSALDAGSESGVFSVDDPILLANLYYTEALGILSFAALQMSVGQGPAVNAAPIDDIKRLARIAAVSQARGQ